MRSNVITRNVLTLAMLCIAGTAMAQDKFDLGRREFDNSCAACHGKDGKGVGSITDLLKKSPPDLSTLSKRNGGVFPLARVYDVIEGAGAGHGTRDMPAWGRTYSMQAADYYMDVPYNSEAYVRTRILALAEYLNRLQTN